MKSLIILAIKPRRMTWMGPAACMDDRRGADRVLAGNPGKETTLKTQA